MEHLTREQIDRYASRRAGVDEILAIANHLDNCDDCRDRAAALIDDGTGSRSHTRKLVPAPPIEEPPRPSRLNLTTIVLIAIAIVALIVAIVIWVR
jgi:predicted anti-sigma-YlaC factor YlaD